MLRVLDLFSGIGAYALGLERAGAETVAFCEIDPFCRRTLAKHWPNVPIHDDITTREFHEGEADIITGGFPCQDISIAGRGAGLSGARSGLWGQLVRALRVVRPRFAIMENVANLLAGPSERPGGWMCRVLGDLAESRFDAEWDCVPAAIFGAPHERDRVWIVAHSDSERCGEARGLRHRSEQVPSGRAAPRPTPLTADAAVEGRSRRGSKGLRRQAGNLATRGAEPGHSEDMGESGLSLDANSPNAKGDGCRQGRARRPPDSFAGVREQTRWYAADPYRARLAFRHGVGRDAWEEFAAAQRNADEDGWQQIWPDEPALQGVDDGPADWVDGVRATGNCNPPIIPETIARAMMAAHLDFRA